MSETIIAELVKAKEWGALATVASILAALDREQAEQPVTIKDGSKPDASWYDCPSTPPAESIGDDSGWVEWGGGEHCPVDSQTLIAIKYRDGDVSMCGREACAFRWNHAGTNGDIVAYKVVEQ